MSLRREPAAGSVAVVTGGSGGIGRAVAEALAGEGVHVALVGLTAERVQTAADDLNRVAGERAGVLPLVLDVREWSDMERMAQATLDRFGRIDLLVAAAGIAREPGSTRLIPSPVAHMPVSEWDAVIATNLRGVFLSNRAVLPAMIRQRSGSIINISSSPAGLQGQAYAAAYSASKFGVRGLSQSLDEEVGRLGIRVHTIFPGLVDTPMVSGTTLPDSLGAPLPPQRVADLVMTLWRLPADSRMVEPTLTPVPGRRKKSKKRRPSATGGG